MKLNGRVWLEFGAAIALLVVVGVAALVQDRGFINAARWVAHSQMVLERLGSLNSAVDELESVQRGYLLTGDQRFRESFDSFTQLQAKRRLGLAPLLQDNSAQSKDLADLDDLIDARIATGRQIMDARRAGTVDLPELAARIRVATDQMQQVRDLIARMKTRERALLDNRATRTRKNAQNLNYLIVLGFVLALMSMMMIGSSVQRLLRALETETAALSDANTTLETRVAERSRAAEQRASDLVRSEKALGRERELLTSIFNSMGEGLVVIDRDRGFLQGNAAIRRMLLFDENDISTSFNSLQELCPTFHLDGTRVSLDNLPLVRALRGDEMNSTRYIIHRTDGKPLLISVTTRQLRDADGSVRGAVLVSRDLTERRETETALERAGKLYAGLFTNMPALFWMKDSSGRLMFVNREWSLLGSVMKDIINNSSPDFWPESAEPFLRRDLVSMFPGVTDHNSIVIEDAERFWVINTFSMDSVDHEARGTAALAFEVTLRIRAERQVTALNDALREQTRELQATNADLRRARDAAMESERLKTEFLANMSHEIRTPMNAIVGMAHLLLNTPLSIEQREFADTVRSSADSLLALIDDILDLSKITAGKLLMEETTLNIRAVVEGTAEMLAERAQKKGLELATFIHENVPETVIGDPARLRQVIANLVGNAVKFTERGEVVVQVSQAGDDESLVKLRFEVRDTGIGISGEHQRHLFRPFTQADSSTTRKYGGTGLGLAISSELVERMGGELRVESQLGVGSVFSFVGRFRRQPAISEGSHPMPGAFDGLHVLAVDDNATNRQILQSMFDSWRMNGSTASNGAEALAILRRAASADEAYGVAVIDMQMPEMDGAALARAIKSDPLLAATRLVALSSIGGLGDIGDSCAIGIDSVVSKPIKQSQLLDCLVQTALPLDQVSTNGGTIATATTRPTLDAIVRRPEKILVAEDNAVNRRLALLQLEHLGYQADAVSNGVEVLRALEQTHYSLILMDCQMPVMDGYETTREIRRRKSGAERIVIVAMTAHAMQGERAKCMATGMDDYLSKPVTPSALEVTLARWLSNASNGELLGDGPLSTDNSPVDAKVIAELRQMPGSEGEPLSDELIDLFLGDLQPRLDAIDTALRQSEASALSVAAHALKGSSGILGAHRMVELCATLEQVARLGSLEQAQPIIHRIAAEASRLRNTLQALRTPVN